MIITSALFIILYHTTPTAVTYTWWRRWRWLALLQTAHALCWPVGAVCSWTAAGRSAGESRSWPAADCWGRGRWRRSGRTVASPSLRCRWPRHRTPWSLRRRWSSRTAGWGTTVIQLYSGEEVRVTDVLGLAILTGVQLGWRHRGKHSCNSYFPICRNRHWFRCFGALKISLAS